MFSNAKYCRQYESHLGYVPNFMPVGKFKKPVCYVDCCCIRTHEVLSKDFV